MSHEGHALSRMGLLAAFGALTLLVLAPLALTGCTRASRDRRVAPGSENGIDTVVLLTIDTWRADSNGFLGGLDPSPTPYLDSLARDGLVAVNASAPVPLTGPSHWSILTGRWPWRDGMRVNGDRSAEGRGRTLAETLSAEGWSSAAFVSCSALDHRYGFAEGFERYDDRFALGGSLRDMAMPERRGDATVAAALAWLEGRDPAKRVFLWVHLFEPHFPYAAPTGALPGAHGAYLGEVAFADAQARRLAEGLETLGRPRRESLWIVLSDHGEGLGEHGERTHGLLLHGATTRIPLLIAGPGVPRGREVVAPASTVDLVPTILELVGIAAPEVDGTDLLGSDLPGDRAIPLESMFGASAFGLSPVFGLRTPGWLWESAPRVRLWKLDDDPDETEDVAARYPERVEAMRVARARAGQPPYAGPAARDAGETERLRALGYLSSGSGAGTEDVRDFSREGAELHFLTLTAQSSGDFEAADRHVSRFLELYPRAASMWVEAGFVAVGLGDLERAAERFATAARISPENTQAQLNLGNALLGLDRLVEAEAAYRRVLELDPEDLFALYNLGSLLVRQGRDAEATEPWRTFVDLYPEHPRAAEVRSWLASPGR